MPSRTRARSKPPRTRGTARRFERQLRKIADHVGSVVQTFPPGDPSVVPTIRSILEKYAESLTDWARAAVSRMLQDVNQQDAQAWAATTRELSRSLQLEIENAPTGQVMRGLLAEQVTLIRSIPLEAARRVHHLTLEGLRNSERASEIAKEIMRSGDVAKSRATLIARTEVARTASVLTQARAQHVGSDGYIWRSSGDSDVRTSHRKMNGKYVSWDQPPTLDNLTGHAGALPNCRCYPEPVIPE